MFYSGIRNILILVLVGVQVCGSLDYPALLLQFPRSAVYQQTEYAVACLKRDVTYSILFVCDMTI